MTEPLYLPGDAEVNTATAALGALAERAAGQTVHDERSLNATTEFMAQLQRVLAETEAARKALVQPLNEHVRFINDTFKLKRGPAEETLRKLKLRVTEYHRKQREAQERVVASANEAARQAEEALGVPAMQISRPQVKTQAHTTSGSAQVKLRWTYEVTSFQKFVEAVAAAEDNGRSLEYVQLDSAVIRREIAAGLREFPGLRIYQTEDVAVRRNS